MSEQDWGWLEQRSRWIYHQGPHGPAKLCIWKETVEEALRMKDTKRVLAIKQVFGTIPPPLEQFLNMQEEE